MTLNPFRPSTGTTKTIAATAVSASVTLDPKDVSSPTLNSGPTGGHGVMRMYNAGPNIAFVRWGQGAQVAVAGDMPLIPGVVEVFGKAWQDDTVAAISPGGTATVYVSCGEGT